MANSPHNKKKAADCRLQTKKNGEKGSKSKTKTKQKQKKDDASVRTKAANCNKKKHIKQKETKKKEEYNWSIRQTALKNEDHLIE